ncbi:MAG: ABC transporter substrate-binding protein, partial [Clostridiales bacterium]|nr:ABC transporter substrate-binding protein [Clostridiales bacterium]
NHTVWAYYVSDIATVFDKIKDGTYDAGYVAADDGEKLKKKSGFTLNECSDVIWGYWFNCNSEVFSVTDMRLAFACSADKSLLSPPDYIEGETNRLLTAAMSPYFDFSPTLISYDEATANEYFKNAINENEELSASITVTVLTAEDFSESVIKQIQVWQRVFGIDVKIKTETRENAVSLMQSGDYEIAFLPVEFSAFNTSEYFKSYVSDSAYNITAYSSEDYDSLVNSITNSMSDDEKISVYKECEQMLISDGVVIPAYTEASYFVQGKGVSGIYSVSEEEIYFRLGTIV